MLGLLPGTIGRYHCGGQAAVCWLPVVGLLPSEVVGFCNYLSSASALLISSTPRAWRASGTPVRLGGA